MDQSFRDALALAIEKLRDTWGLSKARMRPEDVVLKINAALFEIDQALAVVPDLEAVMLATDCPYVRKLVKEEQEIAL